MTASDIAAPQSREAPFSPGKGGAGDPHLPRTLAELGLRVRHDLEMLALPANWIAPQEGPDGEPMLDVAVIGAGMCGIAAAGALKLRGMTNILMLDASADGREGPWITYARMETLRSPKHLPGPCLGLPTLTFRSWYEAAFGRVAWEALYKIPNAVWQDYLVWLRRVLDLPLRSGADVERIDPSEQGVAIHLAGGGTVHARRVVLATGRCGTGGAFVPDMVDPALWPARAAHSSEEIDFARLAGRRVAVIGAGASAWDNAATALEAGAAQVDLYCRRSQLPQVNKGRASAHPGFFEGWAELGVAEKWALFVYLQDNLAPPPHETVLRTIAHDGFRLRLGTPVLAARPGAGGVEIELAGGRETADFLILGTGFAVDLAREPMLAHLAGRFALWEDRYRPPPGLVRPQLGRFPWLGAGFELQGKTGHDHALARIHVFNHAATASLGAIASDIPGVNAGAERIATGITRAFFAEDIAATTDALVAFAEPELETTPYYIPPARAAR